MRWWYSTEFFPQLDAAGVKTILHGGDFFDNRNAINQLDIDFVINFFAQELIKYDMNCIVVLGNHDVAFKNTNRIHSLSILKAAAPDHTHVVEEPEIMVLDGQHFALIPWINSENYDQTMTFLNDIKKKNEVIVLGHFEIAGAKHYASSPPAAHGLDAAMFKKFKSVWSGHFHHQSDLGNVKYLGSAFHLNWQDYGDARGYHLFDGELNFVENEYCLFVELAFDEDLFKTMTDAEMLQAFESRFVRLIVSGDYDKVALMDVIARINRTKPHDLQVINNSIKSSTVVDKQAVEEKTNKSVDDYINTYIESVDEYNTQEVKNMMSGLIRLASEKQVIGE